MVAKLDLHCVEMPDGQTQMRALHRALAVVADALPPPTGRQAGAAAIKGPPATEAERVYEETQCFLKDIREYLEVHRGEVSSMVHGTREVVLELLANDVLATLLTCLDALGFEAQKDTARLFGVVLYIGAPAGIEMQIVQYIQSNPRVLRMLLDGAGRPDIASHCSQMLVVCTKSSQLADALLKENATSRLLELVQHQNFDIASEAFSVLKELLLQQRVVSAAFLKAQFEEFFGAFNMLLEAPDYVNQRQALKLLGQILLDRAYMDVMLAYISSERFLQIHMKLLLHDSNAIQLDTFHVFKIFVANPGKPRRVQQILYQNKDKLLRLLDTFHEKRGGDDAFASDLQALICTLHLLKPPARCSAIPLSKPSEVFGRTQVY